MSTELEPVITLMWDKAEDGTYFARMTVSGLRSERHAACGMRRLPWISCSVCSADSSRNRANDLRNRIRRPHSHQGGRIVNFSSIDIRESVLAVKTAPTRAHKKRRNQSAAYHARVQKKWAKRFGMKSTPCMFKMRDPWTGRETFVVHPSLMPALRAAAAATKGGSAA